jgi:hypothetical protein
MEQLMSRLENPKKAAGDEKHAFLRVCESIQSKRKCSMADAMKEAARDYPDLHQAFIKQGQHPERPLDLPEEEHEFITMVRQYRMERAWKPTKLEAVKALLKTKKGMLAHQDYLRSFNGK